MFKEKLDYAFHFFKFTFNDCILFCFRLLCAGALFLLCCWFLATWVMRERLVARGSPRAHQQAGHPIQELN